MTDGTGCEPRWCGIGEVLLKEHVSRFLRCADTVDPTFAGGDAVMGVPDQMFVNVSVVVEHLALGCACLGIEDLVEIGQRQPMPVDGDFLFLA